MGAADRARIVPVGLAGGITTVGEVMSFLRVIALMVPLAGTLVAAPLMAQSPAAASRPYATTTPFVEGFVAEKVPSLARGVPLNFSVFGSERALVSIYVEGVSGVVDLREVQPGVYEGTHVIAAGDAPHADSRVVATMQRGGQVTRATLVEPLVLTAAALPWGESAGRVAAFEPARPVPIERLPPARNEARRCDRCGIVESVRVVEAPAPADLPGKVTRAFDDHRRIVLGVLDAIGLPFAGRERERIAEGTMEFEVTLRLADGRMATRRFATRPAFRVGDTVTLPPADTRVVTD